MAEHFTELVQQLFGKHSLEDCSEQELRALTEKYPYFNTAQFLLLKKLKKDSDEYRVQLQKAALYHHDILEFDAFVHPEKWVPEEPDFTVEEEEIPFAPKPQIITEQTEDKSKTPEMELEKTEAIQPAELAFEPYHTVDYFASQDIKISQEEITKDSLGKQLKSFTEWLKTMKRLPAVEISKNIDVQSEKKVETLAAHSVEDSSVLTEAMAEVWLRQGNKEKAIEVYNKLCLLNPSKSDYFAAKIENIKQS
ncbi:MAG: hypothetical protein ICV66_01510 [Chitinophagaceae bacterium]|nr:hypothetical protein [Chitinophagaceae bacterium]